MEIDIEEDINVVRRAARRRNQRRLRVRQAYINMNGNLMEIEEGG